MCARKNKACVERRGDEIFLEERTKVKSDRLSGGAMAQDVIKRGTQRLVLLRFLLGGGYLDFGDGPEEEDPQGPKLVNKRLSSG
jgi:hypothetical protein